ncbi:MAG: Hsp33 family molecular chaperone HslO [Nitrosomonas sp.]|nr:Hsp33 family molecular chaperone HslO [Nitrosomonas sp.]MDP1951549.1 Hsp33 family molecular chaperone HslO [Nitrosomonas sp.]
MNNYLQRFLLDDLDIRGAIVHLDSVWQQMLAERNYPAPVVQILGEITATTLLFASNLKQRGRLTTQLSGNGPVSLLVIDCNENLHIRGMAKCTPRVEPAPLPDLLGHGQLVLTLDMASMRDTYQSIVPLEGNNIAEIFEHYLKQSEQLDSRLFLAASVNATVGIFLQKLPTADQRDPDGWTRIEALALTLKDQELFTLQSDELLTRLFNEETVRIFDSQPVDYGCREDWGKVHAMLRSLGREEVDSILREFGEIIINDDICNREYRFDALAIEAVFRDVSPTIH